MTTAEILIAPVIERSFQTAGIREALLPSGYRVRLVVPSVRGMMRRGLLTQRLLGVAWHGHEAAWRDDADHGAERRAAIRDYVDLFVSASLRAIRAPDSETWELLSVAPEDVGGIAPDDLSALEDVVLGILTPEQVTEASEALQRAREALEATP